MDSASWEWLGSVSFNIRHENPQSSFKKGEIEKPESEWWEETYNLSVDEVYAGITINEWPSDEYVVSRLACAHRQLAKGGYRLANILEDIYDKIYPSV